MGFLFSLDSTEQCSSGYLTDEGCSTETVVDHIFSGSRATMTDDDWWDDDDQVGPYGYNTKSYLIPTQSFVSTVTLYGTKNGIRSYYGWFESNNRQPIIWSSFESDPLLQASSHGLSYSSRALPNTTPPLSSANEPNERMYATQELNYQNSLLNVRYPDCVNEEYTEASLIGSNTTDISLIEQNFSAFYADLVVACPECHLHTNSSVIYFNGTLWLTRVGQAGSNQNELHYPYGYLNFMSSALYDDVNYFSNPSCPQEVAVMDMNSYDSYERSQQIQAMTSLNYLTNLLVDPLLNNYTIQGGFTPYGDLDFDATSVSQGESNILTVIAMFLLNGFWPLAVWRLSHERTQELVLMMRTVGMKTESYIGGMFLFDMMISVFSGIAMVVFAVVLNLSQFKGAPIGDLVAIVLLSAWALNALALLMVQLLGKKATILPLLAPCLCVIATALTSLLTVFLYPNDGDWPWGLSLIPFLAQGRALYIILVYHQSSDEVVTAYIFLIFFGLISLTVVYILEAEIPVVVTITTVLKRLMESAEEKEFRRQMEAEGECLELPYRSSIATETRNQGYKTFDGSPMDEDVVQEKLNAVGYIPGSGANTCPHNGEESSLQEKFAIVIRNLRHIFPNGTVAVKDLSLALSYGECFGLLGPNGTGKSTTISILSGTLRASFGDVFISGSDIHKDTSAIHRYVGICPQFDVGESVPPPRSSLTVSSLPSSLSVERPHGGGAPHLPSETERHSLPPPLCRGTKGRSVGGVGWRWVLHQGRRAVRRDEKTTLDRDVSRRQPADHLHGRFSPLSLSLSSCLPEPTTGLDPDNKSLVWSIIQSLKSPSRLILLTTHSMEEAEALCGRIGIMARGELQCIGTSSHLKKKYGKGYTLTINLLKFSPPPAPPHLAPLDKNSSAYVEQEQQYERQTDQCLVHYVTTRLSHGQGKLLSSINRTKKFLIPKVLQSPASSLAPASSSGQRSQERVMNISEIFKEMELHRNELHIREWGLSMSTLEDVFITAVRSNQEEEEERRGDELSLALRVRNESKQSAEEIQVGGGGNPLLK
jgi:ABC-type multidrug transport system ATPase subunit